MKLFSSFAKILLFGALFLGITTAATGDLWSWMDSLSSDIPFGYSSTQQISITNITSTSVTITSPKLKDELDREVLKYTVMYTTSPLADILKDSDLLDASKEKEFSFASGATSITFTLNTTADALDPTKVYYVSVIPKDQSNILGEISNELWFRLSTLSVGSGVFTGTHGAAGADMNLANVTHLINTAARSITLKRTAVNGSDKVDVMLQSTGTTFTKLATVNMSDETYTFTATRNGEYTVKFMPNNGGREKVYTFTVAGLTFTGNPPSRPIPKVPRVGPAENILVAVFIAFILYLLYRRNALRNK